MALAGGKVEVFRRVDPAAVRGEEIRRTNSKENVRADFPQGRPASPAETITESQAKDVFANAGVNSCASMFGRAETYRLCMERVIAATGQVREKFSDCKPEFLEGMCARIIETMSKDIEFRLFGKF